MVIILHTFSYDLLCSFFPLLLLYLLHACSAWSWWNLEVAPASLSHQAIEKEKRREERRRREERGAYNLAVESISHYN